MVDPSCSSGGFDDVQDFHKQRLVIALVILGRAILNERIKNNTAKGCVTQSAKTRAGGIEDDWRGI
jgi:phosphoribosylformimino-5-aminoimidazole carboxamide ribonucleotide (ProFAR) isomerase